MESGPLTKPSGSLCDDEQLLWMSLNILEQGERRFLKALFKGHLTPPVARDLKKDSQRTSGITGN